MHSHSPRHLGLRNPGAQQSCSFQPSLFQFIEISSYPYRISHASKTITEIQKCHYIIQTSIEAKKSSRADFVRAVLLRSFFWSLWRINRAFVIWGDGFFELANRLAERFPQIRNFLRTENQQGDEKNQKQVGWLQ